jgi:hypothetical protein
MLNMLLDQMFHQTELYQEMVLKMYWNQYLEDLNKFFLGNFFFCFFIICIFNRYIIKISFQEIPKEN